mmetsp:Transcript_144447/g.269254  ORF Transcript_144447/g.269254 Transcript_144447/m.269254 type:complete len:83 (-) Transcript_144447:388-636(-)
MWAAKSTIGTALSSRVMSIVIPNVQTRILRSLASRGSVCDQVIRLNMSPAPITPQMAPDAPTLRESGKKIQLTKTEYPPEAR